MTAFLPEPPVQGLSKMLDSVMAEIDLRKAAIETTRAQLALMSHPHWVDYLQKSKAELEKLRYAALSPTDERLSSTVRYAHDQGYLAGQALVLSRIVGSDKKLEADVAMHEKKIEELENAAKQMVAQSSRR